jgi:glycerophosphoryl diester phosphodiesterase
MYAWPSAASPTAWSRPFLGIGHGGASAHAPANSLRSLALALEMGVDVVEFDVRPCRDGLVLQHDATLIAPDGRTVRVSECSLSDLCGDAPGRDAPVATLPAALDLLKGRALINLDLKAAGCEGSVLDLLRARHLLGDTLISSLYPASLRRLRAMEPAVITGFSYPQDKGDASKKPYLQPIVNLVVALMRLSLPYRLLGMAAQAQANAVMLYHKVISPSCVRSVQARGGKVFVWTVDDAALLDRMRALGVDGAATNHPELFRAPS